MIPNLTFIGATEAVSDLYPIQPAGLQSVSTTETDNDSDTDNEQEGD
ncbi:MAG: hypothetical protein IKH15_08115 [Bacteroidales bacterium]|nr:hypothetical protein [Bacteroidales bacterium]MBR4637050.1 hypothetical protein [Bacteroidales bacterium]